MQPTIDALPARIAGKISTDAESGCWVWMAGKNPETGYGQVWLEGAMRLSHRVVYQLLVGNPGPKLDHRCFNHACVNPEHLRPVTTKQNNEHREGPTSRSKSGVRGVYWAKRERRWAVQVTHHGRNHHGGYHCTIEEAEQAAIALRARLFTHDDGRIGR